MGVTPRRAGEPHRTSIMVQAAARWGQLGLQLQACGVVHVNLYA
jgi:hypothetical protein